MWDSIIIGVHQDWRGDFIIIGVDQDWRVRLCTNRSRPGDSIIIVSRPGLTCGSNRSRPGLTLL